MTGQALSLLYIIPLFVPCKLLRVLIRTIRKSSGRVHLITY